MGFAWSEKHRRVYSSIILMFLILMIAGSINYAVAFESSEPHQPNALWIEPSAAQIQTLDEKFNLTVWLNISEECFAWQVKILFNSALFNVSRVGYTDGEKSDFFSNHEAISITPIINQSQGFVVAGETLLENDTRSHGYGSLLWIEFNLKSQPTQGLFDVSFSEPYGTDTFILNPYLDTITIEHVDGAAISFLQPGDTLVQNLILMAIICGIVILVAIGISKRRRAKTDE
ncbi:MAG: hypothetical protein ACFFE6_13755 [Candidatus Thorarchaeota archaeon]